MAWRMPEVLQTEVLRIYRVDWWRCMGALLVVARRSRVGAYVVWGVRWLLWLDK